jgi:hypothetical protein
MDKLRKIAAIGEDVKETSFFYQVSKFAPQASHRLPGTICAASARIRRL